MAWGHRDARWLFNNAETEFSLIKADENIKGRCHEGEKQ